MCDVIAIMSDVMIKILEINKYFSQYKYVLYEHALQNIIFI